MGGGPAGGVVGGRERGEGGNVVPGAGGEGGKGKGGRLVGYGGGEEAVSIENCGERDVVEGERGDAGRSTYQGDGGCLVDVANQSEVASVDRSCTEKVSSFHNNGGFTW